MTEARIEGTEACVFDAYGTLLDFNSAVMHCREETGDSAERLSKIWRQKQLQYTWLRSLMGDHADFWQVTGEALDFSLAAVGIDNPKLRETLMALYRELDTFPDVSDALTRLKDAGMRTAILSNGAPDMLNAAAAASGIDRLLDEILSVEDVGVFKPDPKVYQLAVDRLGVAADRICFMSSNGWDAAGAAGFGFKVAWINRYGQPVEHLPARPDVELDSLAALPAILGLENT
ncbi:MAG: haloacid dehalogenase type II [Alphaproteobacteria bacterium]|nr:haloacid dehalogenase type II [Alphaproteobacteria bacterium]|tara:strand:+ start:2048 stop:2743 length:696 start_codon:yes stop_codon:yes gene_type:complete